MQEPNLEPGTLNHVDFRSRQYNNFFYETITIIILAPELFHQLTVLYGEMESSYNKAAHLLRLSCADCHDNCCDSYFKHHTYIEWTYLWEGMITFPVDRQEIFRQRAGLYLEESEKIMAQGERPLLMCPLNVDGLCALYSHRLMICRLHGVPSNLMRPDGKRLSFPGCFRAQELTAGMDRPHILDRTDFFLRLVVLEKALLGHRRHFLPRVNLTLADMLVQGPPHLS